ncbi:glycerol-3-phosphate dehydrogenase/oxidase [Lysinibacillus sp. SGAir0095]|uniref:glycerol-3-phosphate dehydrogenase/oxidase n=1 Tax=Lysinibacillus sp. SGAir0095 TaxID=2070463 RepID=UPI0010CD0222|nr:glycerol-3-phosphate dehydrogenase/oxidase [Lysinibacillus sp. SGAir0095]QCR32020.1 glycerol-3-phosphate dehydrogenase [Lysinibacillus sp. SGAir0095]
MFSFKERPNILNTLDSFTFDVLVIGGGITGAGIALDAASRGLSVALVEMQDFAAGTSSRSTKLVHGGLRYLKQFEVGLVAEVGREREIVYENGVHVTQPEWMLLPLYKEGTLGKMTTRAALTVYDRLAQVRKDERRKILSKKEALAKVPLLKTKGLRGAGYYVEYKTDDARLTIEVLKKAVEYQAICLNYAKVTDFVYKKKKIVAANVRDEISGEQITIHAHQIVNATGPWVDDVRKMDKINNKKTIRHTKGVHIVIDQKKLPLEQAVYFDTVDGRMVFAIPREGKTYVGTTDTFYKGDLIQPIATKEDVDYLIDAIRFIFPEATVTKDDVESTWAGVRPLISQEGKDPSEISRKDELWIAPSGLLTVAGGKLTGYRQMAETIVHKIVKLHKFKHATECITKELSISGAKGLNSYNFEDYVTNKSKEGTELGISYPNTQRLVRKYGTNVDEVFQYVKAVNNCELDIPPSLYAELLYSIYYEMVMTPCDFLIRRTGYMYFNIALVEQYKEAILEIMSNILGYSESEMVFYRAQLEQFIDEAKNPMK